MVATVLEEAAHEWEAVLAIGTANPANQVLQDEFPDWYFCVTRSDHLVTLKAKMRRICEKSGVSKHRFLHTEDTIASHPEFLDRSLPSLSARLSVAEDAIPELAAAAAKRAIAEWGRPTTDITHLVVTTSSGARSPGADLRLAAILGLRPTVQRTMLYLHGCSAGSGALRLAKDLAENNHGARVLVVCVEATIFPFHAPDEAHPDALVVTSLLSDGAGAVIVGADPALPTERAIFHMVSASQATLPGTERVVWMRLGESGLDYRMSAELPALVRDNIEQCLVDALAPLGLPRGDNGWNGLFWAVHPGGPAIMDSYEKALGLENGKLAVSRHVLSEYGNMIGATIIFVLDQLRHRRHGGDVDLEWGVLLGLGPGLTVETMVLRDARGREEY